MRGRGEDQIRKTRRHPPDNHPRNVKRFWMKRILSDRMATSEQQKAPTSFHGTADKAQDFHAPCQIRSRDTITRKWPRADTKSQCSPGFAAECEAVPRFVHNGWTRDPRGYDLTTIVSMNPWPKASFIFACGLRCLARSVMFPRTPAVTPWPKEVACSANQASMEPKTDDGYEGLTPLRIHGPGSGARWKAAGPPQIPL